MATDFPGVGQAELQARGAEWTAREIAQQPSVWPHVERLVSEQRAQLDRFLQPLLTKSSLRVVMSGAGTSLTPALRSKARHWSGSPPSAASLFAVKAPTGSFRSSLVHGTSCGWRRT